MESIIDVQKAIYGPDEAGPPLLPHGDDPKAVRAPRKRRRIQLRSSRASVPLAASTGANASAPAFPASQLPEGFPPDLAFRALASYSLIRTLSIRLRLSPFTPNVFLRALYLPFPNRLMGQIHVALLRFLLAQLHMGYHWSGNKASTPAHCFVKKRKVDGLRWPLRAGDNLEYLDTYSWPIFFDDYCHLTADSLYASINDTTDHLDVRSLHISSVEMHGEQQDEDYYRRAISMQRAGPSVLYLEGDDNEDTGNKQESDEEFGADDIVEDEGDDEDYEAAPRRPKKRAKSQATPAQHQHHHVPDARMAYQQPSYSRAMMGDSSQQQLMQLNAKQQQEIHALQSKRLQLEAKQQQMWSCFWQNQNQGSHGQQPPLATADFLQSRGQGAPSSHRDYAPLPQGAVVPQGHGHVAPFFPVSVPIMGNSQPLPLGQRQYQQSSVSQTGPIPPSRSSAGPGAQAQSQHHGHSVSRPVPNVPNHTFAGQGAQAQSQHHGFPVSRAFPNALGSVVSQPVPHALNHSSADLGSQAHNQHHGSLVSRAGPIALGSGVSQPVSHAPNHSSAGLGSQAQSQHHGFPVLRSVPNSPGSGVSQPVSPAPNHSSAGLASQAQSQHHGSFHSRAGPTVQNHTAAGPGAEALSQHQEYPVSRAVANGPNRSSTGPGTQAKSEGPSISLPVAFQVGNLALPVNESSAACEKQPPSSEHMNRISLAGHTSSDVSHARSYGNGGELPVSNPKGLNSPSVSYPTKDRSEGIVSTSAGGSHPTREFNPTVDQEVSVPFSGPSLGAGDVASSSNLSAPYPSKGSSHGVQPSSNVLEVSFSPDRLSTPTVVPAMKQNANVEMTTGVIGAALVASSVVDSTNVHGANAQAVPQPLSALLAAPLATSERSVGSSAGVHGSVSACSSAPIAAGLSGTPHVAQSTKPASSLRSTHTSPAHLALSEIYAAGISASSLLPAAPPISNKTTASSLGVVGVTPAASLMPNAPALNNVYSPPTPRLTHLASSKIATETTSAPSAKRPHFLRKGDIGGILEAFIQGREINVSADDASLDAAEEGETVGAEDSFSSQYLHDSDPWPHFRPLRRMRAGIPYHRLLLEDKLDALEFLLDELLSSSEISDEFMHRQVTTTCRNSPYNTVPYGCLPTSDELQNIENQDECAVCRKEGELLCCDGCPASYHSACIGMSKHSLPEGRWLCPECTHVDPAKFGTLHGGRKSALDWFTMYDLGRAAARRSYTSVEGHASGQIHGPEALVVDGFVFSRKLANDTDVQRYSPATEQKFLPLNHDLLKHFVSNFGPAGLSQWPLEQIPVNARVLWANPLLSDGPCYFPTSETFDPSLYQSKYRKAPHPPPMNKVDDPHLSDYENQCGSASIYALSARLSCEMSSDDAIAMALRGSVDLFDPYQMIRSYVLDLEKKLSKACLIDAAWGTRNTNGKMDSWSASVRKCISIPRLAKLVLKLVDAAHSRAFLETWYHVASTRPQDPTSTKTSAITEQPVYFQLSSDTDPKAESLRRHWERCASGNIPTLLAKESCRLEDWIIETRPDLAAATMDRTKRKQVRASGRGVSKDVESTNVVSSATERRVSKGADSFSENVIHPAESTSFQNDAKAAAFRDPSLAVEMADVEEDDGQANPDALFEKKPKKASRKRRSGRIKTTGGNGSETAVWAASSLQTADDGSVQNIMKRIDLQKRAKMCELEEEIATPTMVDILWPVAGRNLFDPVGYLPNSSVRRLARNAGSIVAPFVTYSRTYEVGLVSCYHVWRKRVLFCKSFEELLMQLRVLESFVDSTTIRKCISIAQRSQASKDTARYVVRSTQKDINTGLDYHLVEARGQQRAAWISYREIDLPSLVREYSNRRSVSTNTFKERWSAKMILEKAKEKASAALRLASKKMPVSTGTAVPISRAVPAQKKARQQVSRPYVPAPAVKQQPHATQIATLKQQPRAMQSAVFQPEFTAKQEVSSSSKPPNLEEEIGSIMRYHKTETQMILCRTDLTTDTSELDAQLQTLRLRSGLRLRNVMQLGGYSCSAEQILSELKQVEVEALQLPAEEDSRLQPNPQNADQTQFAGAPVPQASLTHLPSMTETAYAAPSMNSGVELYASNWSSQPQVVGGPSPHDAQQLTWNSALNGQEGVREPLPPPHDFAHLQNALGPMLSQMQQSTGPPAPTWMNQNSSLPHQSTAPSASSRRDHLSSFPQQSTASFPQQSTAPPAPTWGNQHMSLPQIQQSTGSPAPPWGNQHSGFPPRMEQSLAAPAPTWVDPMNNHGDAPSFNTGGVFRGNGDLNRSNYEGQGSQQQYMNRGAPLAMLNMQPNSFDPWSTNGDSMPQNRGTPLAMQSLPQNQFAPWQPNGSVTPQNPGAASFHQGTSAGQPSNFNPISWPPNGSAMQQDPGAASFQQGSSTGQALNFNSLSWPPNGSAMQQDSGAASFQQGSSTGQALNFNSLSWPPNGSAMQQDSGAASYHQGTSTGQASNFNQQMQQMHCLPGSNQQQQPQPHYRR